jgi:hypothetical protein
MSRCSRGRGVDLRAAHDGLEYFHAGDLVRRDLEHVAIEDDEVGELADLDRSGERILITIRRMNSS